MIYVRKTPCNICKSDVFINTTLMRIACSGCGSKTVEKAYLKSKDFEENYELVCI